MRLFLDAIVEKALSERQCELDAGDGRFPDFGGNDDDAAAAVRGSTGNTLIECVEEVAIDGRRFVLCITNGAAI